jgi:hypothetical protein
MNPVSGPGPNQPPSFNQTNTANSGGAVYANQGTGNQIINTGPVPKRGPRTDTKVLLIMIVADVGVFWYGAASFTGRDTTANQWHAGIFLVMLGITIRMIKRWMHRRV